MSHEIVLEHGSEPLRDQGGIGFSSGISGGWIPCSSHLGLSSHVRGEGEWEMGMG